MGVDRSRLPAVGAAPAFRFPDIEQGMLPNGVRLWTIDHRQTDLVTWLLLLRSGSAADPPDRPGLAALTGDLLDDGSGDRTGIELHAALARIGGGLGTEVTSDATVVSVTALARHAREALALLVEIAARPRFDPSEVERVRRLRLSRLAQVKQVPAVVADRAYLHAIYGSHPYGHLSIGTKASLRVISVDDVKTFHARHFDARGWTVIASGADSAHLREVAEDQLGTMAEPAGPDAVAGTTPSAPPSPPHRMVFVPRAGAAQSEIRLGHLGAARSSPSYHALLVLNMVLGGQFVSRINLNLREDKGYTYGAHTAFDCRRGRGPFTLQAAVKTAVTTDAIHQAVGEIAAIRDTRPVTADELDGARAALTSGFARTFETAGQLTRAAARLALFDLPHDEYNDFARRVASVDVDTVAQAATRHLHPDRLVAVVVGAPDEVRPSLGGLGFGAPVER